MTIDSHRNLMRTSARLHAIVFGIGLLSAGPLALSAEWLIEPSIRIKSGYTDDIKLFDNEKTPTADWSYELGSKFAVQSDIWKLHGSAEIGSRRYDDKSVSDEDIWEAEIGYAYMTELDQYTLDSRLQRDSTLGTEAEQTGIVFGRSERTLLSIAPGWRKQLTEATSLSTTINYTDVSYKDLDTTPTGAKDYTQGSVYAGLVHNLSERTQVSGGLNYLVYEPDDHSSTYKIYVAQIGFTHYFSDTLSSSLSVGSRENRTTIRTGCSEIFPGYVICGDIPPIHTKGRGYNFAFALNKKLETGNVGLNLTRDSQPTATQGVIETTRARVAWTNKFNDRLDGILSASASSTQGLDDSSSLATQKYYIITATLGYDYSKDWRIEASYHHHEQTDVTDVVRKSNSVDLTLKYSWPRISVSR